MAVAGCAALAAWADGDDAGSALLAARGAAAMEVRCPGDEALRRRPPGVLEVVTAASPPAPAALAPPPAAAAPPAGALADEAA